MNSEINSQANSKHNQTTEDQLTDFGFSNIALAEKTDKVKRVFSSVASKYDLMNDAMSLGIHRIWKRTFVSMAQVQKGDKLLDLASGSGDIALAIAKAYPHYGELVVSDNNQDMLDLAKKNLINKGVLGKVKFELINAEEIGYPNDYFNSVFISFGLRNAANKEKVIASVYDKLRRGGQFMILEFSQVNNKLLAALYDKYSFNLIPKLGKIIAKDEDSYKYLVESIRVHPTQTKLLAMMKEAGFINCQYYNMSQGIVAIHKAIKP